MLTKRIIPCLDVKDGRVVKGVQFLDHRDAGDPVEMAARYNREGADELVFYDITASSDGRGLMRDLMSRVAEQVFIPLTVGGGLRSVSDMSEMLQAGADKVSINTAAVENPNLIQQGAEYFGSQCIVLGIDARRITNRLPLAWEVRIRTGDSFGGNPTGLDVIEWASAAVKLGAGEIVVNSMDYDGVKQGYDLELLQALSKVITVPIVASGGAGEPEHMYRAFKEGKADAALAASMFHYGTVSIDEAKTFLINKGLPVRPVELSHSP
ncbi:imidazole glycerol phosphate synthase subunit HisF [SAR202 cluster bacterium AD-802-E10_MRT_200m]|nr:imidazole glycerol phosphate synthase subunit HisF [SAR202 cluster bacterium AD-802-E10_MRT_200m]